MGLIKRNKKNMQVMDMKFLEIFSQNKKEYIEIKFL